MLSVPANGGSRSAPSDNTLGNRGSSAMEPRDVAPGPIIEPRWLDVDTAAQYLCMSRHALYHRISRRQIPFVRRDRIIRFDRQALDRWMSKGVRNGFEEARRDLVLSENDQRSAVPRVHRVRG